MQAAFCQTLLLANMKFSLVALPLLPAEGCILGAAKEPAGCDSRRRSPKVGLSGILLPHGLPAVRKREQEAPGFFAHWG